MQSKMVTMKSCMMELQVYAYLNEDVFLLTSELSSETLARNLEYEPRKALLCRKPFITTYFQKVSALLPITEHHIRPCRLPANERCWT